MVLKLIQVCLPIKKFKILVSSIKREMGVLEHMMVLSTRETQTEAHLKGMGWNLITQGKALPYPDRCPIFGHLVSMNIIVWNCHGALSPNFGCAVADLVRDYSPTMMIVTETRVGGERAKVITDRLPFDGAIYTNTVGYAGGIWLL